MTAAQGLGFALLALSAFGASAWRYLLGAAERHVLRELWTVRK
jgi:hypothetical protein